MKTRNCFFTLPVFLFLPFYVITDNVCPNGGDSFCFFQNENNISIEKNTTALPPLLMDCGEPFFDPGGAGGDFQPGQSQLITFCPDNPDDFIAVRFDEWDLGPCCDATLEVHQGSTLGNIVAIFDGNQRPLLASGFEPGCLTFNFTANANATPASGWEAEVLCSPCSPPNEHFVENIGQEDAGIFVFVPLFEGILIWEVGNPGFTPSNGEAVASGFSFQETVNLFGLESGTAYDVYVANFCNNLMDTSAFYGPIQITTMPTCGDLFFDPGGPNGDLPLNTLVSGVICPETVGVSVKITFDTFDLGPCCNMLEIYDSDFPGINLIGTFSGTDNPGTVVATGFGGCLSFILETPGPDTGFGWEANVTCETCPPPSNFTIDQLTSTSAEFSWNLIMPAEFYYFEVGLPGFVPGSGDFLASGNVLQQNAFVPGLQGNTDYEIAVRAHCSQMDTSAFSLPFAFTTSPSCGDGYFDPGGPDGDYEPDLFLTTTICPDQPGAFVQIDFDSFALSASSFFEIYDSPDPFINTLVSWSGVVSPTSVVATNPSGCLTTILFSGSDAGYGWDASISCVSCPQPNSLNVFEGFGGFDFSWLGSGNNFLWEIGLAGFEPGAGMAVMEGATPFTSVFNINGLDGGTEHEFYVKSDCGGGDTSSFAGPLSFLTPPGCGDTFYDPGGPNGDYLPFQFTETSICPDEPNTFVQLVFTELDVPSCCADLSISTGLNSIEIDLDGGLPPPITSASSNGCLTVFFNVFDSFQIGSGWEATINCVTCPPIPQFDVTQVTENTVSFSWLSLFTTESFEWELGLKGFVPGTGSAIIFSSVPSFPSNGTATGLQPDTEYEFYVRNACSSDTSNYTGPFFFRTAPVCGGQFYDPAGPDSNYVGNGGFFNTIICPEQSGQFVEVDFTSFEIAPFDNDRLEAFNGEGINGPSLGVYTDNAPPSIVSSTDASGCLTFQFLRLSGGVFPGWEAMVNCVTCPRMNGLEISNVETGQVEISWNDIPTANGYFLEIGLPGFEPGTGMALDSGTTGSNTTSFTFDGLESGTFYEVYVQVDCGGETSPFSLPLSVATLPTCGDFFFDPGGPNDQYPSDQTTVTTICPEGTDQNLTVAFNLFNIHNDFLNAFDGPSLFSPLVSTFFGNLLPSPITSTHPSGCLTFEFIAGNNGGGNGWEAIVSCDPPTVVGQLGKESFYFEVFPNPVSSLLSVRFGQPVAGQVVLRVQDIMGRQVLEKTTFAQIGRNDLNLDLNKLTNGAYLISLEGEHGTAFQRVVKY